MTPQSHAEQTPASATFAQACVTRCESPLSDGVGQPLTAEYVRSVLDYDPATGMFQWKVRAGTRRYKGSLAGHLDTNGYRVITIRRKAHKAHRLAWLYMHGEWPSKDLDHINGFVADNRIENLRECDPATNGQNATDLPVTNTSGYRGVSLLGGKWRACLQRHGKKHYLGLYDTPEEAAAAIELARPTLHPFASGRPIQPEEKQAVIRRSADLMAAAYLRWKQSGRMTDANGYTRARQIWESAVEKWGNTNV